MEITVAPSNFDLYHNTKQQQNEIDELKHENIELKKDIEDLKRNLSYQLNILL